MSYDRVEGILKIQIFLEVSTLSTGKGFVSFGGIEVPPFSVSSSLKSFSVLVLKMCALDSSETSVST